MEFEFLCSSDDDDDASGRCASEGKYFFDLIITGRPYNPPYNPPFK